MSLSITKVLISDKVDASCKDVFDKHSISVDYKPGMKKEELQEIIKNYDALIVRSATKVTADIFECAPRLKLVGRAGTGVDNIDLVAASKHGVLVMNTPGGNTMSAAEHTCAMIAAVARNIGQGHATLLEGKWERSKLMGCELYGKTLAIVGLGRIGREVAYRMQAYGMTTIGYDPMVSAEEAAKSNIEYMQLDKLWPLADFVTVHTPLIPQTKGMINEKVFSGCKAGMKVVNVARGGIIDETDLLQALRDGKCGGAALDVFVTEPPTGVSFDLIKHPKVVATPHLGASTIEAQLRVAREISEQIVDAVNGKPMVGLVNAPALAESGNPAFKPYMALAERLGKITGVLCGETKELTVQTSGESLKSASRLLSTAVSYGVAKQHNANANLINANSILKELNIQVKGVHSTESTTTSVSIILSGKPAFSGVLNGDLPTITMLHGAKLTSPVTLTENLITAHSGSHSPKQLLKLLADVDFTSVSTGLSNGKSVLAASHEGKATQGLAAPIKFIEL